MSELPVGKKSLGQHWLTDQNALQAICDAGEITAEDTVLEIGPGTGTLTELLVQSAYEVIAVEKDHQLAQKLSERTDLSGLGQVNTLEMQSKRLLQGRTFQKTKKLTVTEGDILTFDLTSLPPDYKVVANIPYYLTGNLIRNLSETSNQAARVVLLVQKEVAQRVAAAPGQMSLMSVSAQFYWDVSLGLQIPARLFTPPPKVDSQVLILQRPPQLLFPDVDGKKFFQVVKAGFANRRKTLLNSLAGGLRTDKEQIQSILSQADISASLRAQALSLEDWYSVYKICLAAKLI